MGDEPYDEDNDYAWTELAFAALERGELHGEVSDNGGVVSSRVHGPCPRCGHALDDVQTHSAVTDLLDPTRATASDTDPAYHGVDVTCACNRPHARAPENAKGCGVSFRVELLVRRAPGEE